VLAVFLQRHELERAGDAVGEELRRIGRAVEVAVGRHDEPILAGVEGQEGAEFPAGVGVPEAGGAVAGAGDEPLAIAAQADAIDIARMIGEGADLLPRGHIPQDRRPVTSRVLKNPGFRPVFLLSVVSATSLK
jgi:hypothetical protein